MLINQDDTVQVLCSSSVRISYAYLFFCGIAASSIRCVKSKNKVQDIRHEYMTMLYRVLIVKTPIEFETIEILSCVSSFSYLVLTHQTHPY